MNRHAFALTAVLFAVSCSDDPPSTPETPPDTNTGTLRGTVTLFGKADATGTSVMIDGVEKAQASADGSFAIDGLAPGLYELSFRNGSYEERVPGVLFLPEAGAFVGSPTELTPLPKVELQNARRVYAGSGLFYDAADALAETPSGNKIAFLSDYSRFASDGTLTTVDVGTGLAERIAEGVSTDPDILSRGSIVYRTTDQLWIWDLHPTYSGPARQLFARDVQQSFVAPVDFPFNGIVYAELLEGGVRVLEEQVFSSTAAPRWAGYKESWLISTGLLITHAGGLSFRPFSDVSAVESLVDAGAEYLLAASRDGSTVVYKKGTSVYAKRIEPPGPATAVVSTTGTFLGSNGWAITDTGSHVFYYQSGKYWARDTAAAHPALDLFMTSNFRLIGTTPDGKTAVLTGGPNNFSIFGCTLFLGAPLDATLSLSCFVENMQFDGQAELTPDGNRLLYIGTTGEGKSALFSVAVARGTPVQLSLGARSFFVTPDGSAAIVNLHLGNQDPVMLQVVPVAGGEIWELPNAHSASVSPDGGKLLVFDREDDERSGVRVCRLATRECTPLAGQVRSAAWKSSSNIALMRQAANSEAAFQDGIYLANIDPYVVDLSHDGTLTFSFGGTGDEERRFQLFTAAVEGATPTTLSSVEVQIRRFPGTLPASDAMVELYDTDQGKPTGSPLATARIPAGAADPTCSVEVAPLYAKITPGHTYAVVLGQETPAAAHYEWCVNTPGKAPFGKYTGTAWVDESNLGSGWLRVHLGD